MVFQIGGVSKALGLGDVRRCGDQDVPVSHQPSEDKAAFGLAANPQRDIHLILHQIKVPIGYKNFGGGLRMTLKKTVDQGDQEEVGKARWRSQPKRSRYYSLAFLQCGACTVETIQNLLAMRQKIAAGLAWP